MALMKCPKCESTTYRKNGRRTGRQNYLCKNCGRQFLEPLSPQLPQDNEINLVPVASNGHAVAPVTEAKSLPFVKLPMEAATPQDLAKVTAKEQLQSLLSPDLLESYFKEFIQKFQELKEPSAKSAPPDPIAILLLDAENLKIDNYIEKFLGNLCSYPLQVKIAFANWKNTSMGKQDTELYERGYQLVHVPGGKDSADAKMIALGSSIARLYPNVKEVFVCSCDLLLTHLCNELQNQGLTVYWVRRQDNNLRVENLDSGEVNHYSLAMKTEIPSFEEFANKLEELIKAEQQSITERIANLSTVAILFQERCNLSLNVKHSNAIGVEESESSTPVPAATQTLTENTDETDARAAALPLADTISINSIEKLELVILAIIKMMSVEYRRDYVSVTKLKTRFHLQYKESADSIVKKLQPSSSLIKFFRARPSLFKLALVGKEYEVALA